MIKTNHKVIHHKTISDSLLPNIEPIFIAPIRRVTLVPIHIPLSIEMDTFNTMSSK